MNINDVLEALKTKEDGKQFAIFSKGSVALSAKAKKDGNTAYKVSMMPVVKGVKYTDRKSVQDKINEGYEVSHSLPWGEWSTEPGEENLIINHKDNKYLRLYLEGQTMTKYYLNEKEITRDDLKESGLVNASFFKSSSEQLDTMTVNIDNILAII